jgi:hypothetical protein
MVAGRSGIGTPTAQHRVAAALAFASQLAHLWILPEEFSARPLVGTFVFLAAVFQGLLAASLLFGPGRWAVRLGILLNATLVLACQPVEEVGTELVATTNEARNAPKMAYSARFTVVGPVDDIRHARSNLWRPGR